jgi:hypothetical protein
MIKTIFLAGFLAFASNHLQAEILSDRFIQYHPVHLNAADKKILTESLSKLHERYDPKEKMLTKTLNAWNYHTDAETGVFHEVRASFGYAVGLLDIEDKKYTQRAFDIIDKTIDLQDTVATSKTCGVWPYYQEEPLATKKSPADWNWADFNAVSLLDIYMGHQARLPAQLKAKIRRSLILAAQSIQKRDVQPGYTNIAIMGTYVTYLTSHLFDLPQMKEYASSRLQKFYSYTLEKGFTEYNSPTYTIVALDELDRMKRHIIDPESKPKIDSLYSIGWSVIAKHYHKPTGQWAGPHSRSYNTLLQSSVNGIFKQASNGKIDPSGATTRSDVKIKHQIPKYLLSYFLSPIYPRTEIDQLTTDDPRIVGTTYLTPKYALSTANRSSLWNQRRPFLAYWGTPEKPYYLQPRLLHDLYDFSAASFYSAQKDNDVLAAVTFMTNGGDKHINIDKLKGGKFKAKDLRLRFEIGNSSDSNSLSVPVKTGDPLQFIIGDMRLDIMAFYSDFAASGGVWEKGGDGKNSWIDLVFYKGEEKDFDLSTMKEAVVNFTYSMGTVGEKPVSVKPTVNIKDNSMETVWKGLTLVVPYKPILQPKNI